MRRMLSVLVATIVTAAGAFGQNTEILPAPTGPHKTGRMSFHWVDEARAELETKAPDDKRELMVHVFYPADASATGERAVYVPDAEDMKGPWNGEALERINAMRAYSIESAALAAGDARYPVVLFAPGGGMKGLTYHVLCEDLASHGWVVAALDPSYNARAVRMPDGRVLGRLSPSDRGWPEPTSQEEELKYYQERLAQWIGDASFVIDQLTALDAGDGPFAKRLDVQRGVGMVGHSRGGQAAGAARMFEPRIRGGINIDGMMGPFAILPMKGDGVSGDQPFLWFQKALPPLPDDEQLARMKRTRAEMDAEVARIKGGWNKSLEAISGGAIRVYVTRPGIEHIDFSDEPFWDGNMTAETRPAKEQTIADTRAWVRAFFDGTVRGEWENLKALINRQNPEWAVDTFGKMWP